jgi:hypothetical protein
MFKCDDVTIKLVALEQKSACLNSKKNIEERKGAYLVVFMFFTILPSSSHMGTPSLSACFSSLF